MRSQRLGGVAALDRLVPYDSSSIWVRLATSDVVTASGKVLVAPVILARISVAQVGLLLWYSRVLWCSVSVEWVRLVLSTLGTVQGASADSSSAWTSTSSNGVIVRIRIGGSADIRHAICFSRRRELDRSLVGISIAITANTMTSRAVSVVVVEAGVVCSGSCFRSGKCNILVEPFRAPTTDYRCDNKYQYRESNEAHHGKSSSDSSGIFKEPFAGVGIHNSGSSRSRSNNSGDEYRVTIGN